MILTTKQKEKISLSLHKHLQVTLQNFYLTSDQTEDYIEFYYFLIRINDIESP